MARNIAVFVLFAFLTGSVKCSVYWMHPETLALLLTLLNNLHLDANYLFV